jgi:NAD+ synthase (glutamine-hydrolysing)
MVGLFDYMRKTKSKGFMVSLSGGYDSTVCAYLIANMLLTAFEELGESQFESLTGLACKDKKDLMINKINKLHIKISKKRRKKYSTN